MCLLLNLGAACLCLQSSLQSLLPVILENELYQRKDEKGQVAKLENLHPGKQILLQPLLFNYHAALTIISHLPRLFACSFCLAASPPSSPRPFNVSFVDALRCCSCNYSKINMCPSCSTWKLALRLVVHIGHFVNLISFHSKAFPIFLRTKTHECFISLMWHTHKPVSLNLSQVTGMQEADGLKRGMLASELRCHIYPECYLCICEPLTRMGFSIAGQNGLKHVCLFLICYSSQQGFVHI